MKRYKQTETREMAEVLRRDGVLSVPTDTVYGVCARMGSSQAQERLRSVKNRPESKALPVMCADMVQIESVAEVTDLARKLIESFMPGPVTLVMKKKKEVPEFVNGGLATIAVRMAPGFALKKLIEELEEPVYMTSANQSGFPVSRSLDEIEASCPLLDGMMEGEPSFGEASTIIDCTGREPVILRQGPVSWEAIEQALK